MSTHAEIREKQREALFDLLEIQKLNKDATVKGLNSKIVRCKAAMEKDDINHVMQMIKELDD